MDPDGTRAAADGWLVAHMHYAVADAWLMAGNGHEAMLVLDAAGDSAWAEAKDPRRNVTEQRERAAELVSQSRMAFADWLDRHSDASEAAKAIWHHLSKDDEAFPAPAATLGEGDVVQLVWSLPGLLLELDVGRDGRLEWYAFDRITERHDGDEDTQLGSAKLDIWLGRVRNGGALRTSG